MGHLSAKDIYNQLHDRIDQTATRAPHSEVFREILEELYSPEDAALIVQIPFGAASAAQIAQTTGRDLTRLRRELDSLAERGLVFDLHIEGEYYYQVSPLVIGIFEFTMMRTDAQVDSPKMARLFAEYIGSGLLYSGNLSEGQQVSSLRALPHETTGPDYLEILDFEKATAIVEMHDTFAVSICSCRHEHEHLGDRQCDIPLESCTSFGAAADFSLRRGLAKPWSRTQMLEHLDFSREQGLILCADNVQRAPMFMCHCCGCCCNAIGGLSKFGYPNAVATTRFVPRETVDMCKGCNHCEKACPIHVITMAPDPNPSTRRKKRPVVDHDLCLGCGVCVLKCKTGAMHLEHRGQRVIQPETAFARVLYASLEQGTLQTLLFNNPMATSHKWARALVGGFLKLSPVKRALMSDTLRSRFLKVMEKGATLQGAGPFVRM